MNVDRLKEAEAAFLARYPLGFGDPGLAAVRKRHNVDRLAELARTELTESAFAQPRRFTDVLRDVVSRSSMVSRFEKPPFRELVDSLGPSERRRLADAYRRRLIGRGKRRGFGEIVEFFAQYRLARWSIVSALPFYFAPTKEAFVKPTTAKLIVAALEVAELDYRPRPDWAFYDGYRKLLIDIGKQVDPTLTPNNAATAGFLMSVL